MNVSAATNALEDIVSAVKRYATIPELEEFRAISTTQLQSEDLKILRNEMLSNIARSAVSFQRAIDVFAELKRGHKSDAKVLFSFMMLLALIMLVVFVMLIFTVYKKYDREKEARKTKWEGLEHDHIDKLFMEIDEAEYKLKFYLKEFIFVTLICVCIIVLVFAVKWNKYMKIFREKMFEFNPQFDPRLTQLFAAMNNKVIKLYIMSMETPDSLLFVTINSELDLNLTKTVDRRLILDTPEPMVNEGDYTALMTSLKNVYQNNSKLLDSVRSFDVNDMTSSLVGPANQLQQLVLRENDAEEGTVVPAPTSQQLMDIARNEIVPALLPNLVFTRFTQLVRPPPVFPAQSVRVTSKEKAVDVDSALPKTIFEGPTTSRTEFLKTLDVLKSDSTTAYGIWRTELKYDDEKGSRLPIVFEGVPDDVIGAISTFYAPDAIVPPSLLAPADGNKLTSQQSSLMEFLKYTYESGTDEASKKAALTEVVRKVSKLLEENVGASGFIFHYVSVIKESSTTYAIYLYRRDGSKGVLGATLGTTLDSTASESDIQYKVLQDPDVYQYGQFKLLVETDFEGFTVFNRGMLDTGIINIVSSQAVSQNAPGIGPFYVDRPFSSALHAWQPQEPLATASELSDLYKRRTLNVLAAYKYSFSIAGIQDAVVESVMNLQNITDTAIAAQVKQAYIDILQDTQNEAVLASKSGSSQRFISFDRFKAKVSAMKGMDIVDELLIPLQQMSWVGRELQQHYIRNSTYFNYQGLLLLVYKIVAVMFLLIVVIWMLFYTIRRHIKEGIKEKILEINSAKLQIEGKLDEDLGTQPDGIEKANKYVEGILIKQVLVWVVAIMLIVVMFAYQSKADGINKYNLNLAEYNARQLISSAEDTVATLVARANNGPAFDFGLQPLVDRTLALQNETLSWFQTTVLQVKPQLSKLVTTTGTDEPIRRVYEGVIEVVRAYESGNALLLTRGTPPFPYVDVIGNGVLLAITLAMVLAVYKTMNPFDNIQAARELNLKIARYKNDPYDAKGKLDLECAVLRDSNSYEIQKLTLNIVIGVVGVFFVISYIAKVYRSGKEYGIALYGSPMYNERKAYKLQ